MIYPSVRQYREAIADSQDNLSELNYLTPVMDSTGKPYMITGGFAVVFKMQDDEGNLFALKCFTKEQKGREDAYKKIASELDYDDSGYMTDFKYYEKELFVDCGDTTVEAPVVFMDWVEGVTLDKYLNEGTPDMPQLVYRFSLLTRWLLNATFAHGDIKPDNIIVTPQGKLVLVDYDSMFVPSMAGEEARDQGTPGYSHPLRSTMPFDKHIDDFPLMLILFSLKAIAIDPSLKASGDRIVFSADDLANPTSSAVFCKLQNVLSDAESIRLFSLFGIALAQGSLDGVDSKLTHLHRPERRPTQIPSQPRDLLSISVAGVSFNMVYVEPGTFMMGAAPNQEAEAYDYEKPRHQVTLTQPYYIGETQVTQALWQAVMGNNPSCFKGDLQRPVETVSWNDCQAFIQKLNQLTGRRFALPTEAQWEFAARGGKKSKGFKYSGSDDLCEVAWFGQSNGVTYDNGNSGEQTHPVKKKKPNELGIYDMSGNVWEMSKDWWVDSYEASSVDSIGPTIGHCRVARGGSWEDEAQDCRSSFRLPLDDSASYLGLRLVLLPDSEVETFSISGVSFNMIKIEPGTFMMGVPDHDLEGFSDIESEFILEHSRPCHQVTLTQPYYIGETQVTQALWQAVMGSNPSRFTGDLQRPVEQVSWNDCQEFIQKLNQLTGKRFALPTEAQWEFAARGGRKSKGFKYAGSDNADEVAWWDESLYVGSTHPVKTKAPNELGIYDMSGNVDEWCQDGWSYDYSNASSVDPVGPSSGSRRVLRGGCWCSFVQGCRSSDRRDSDSDSCGDILGFRLVLLLD